MVKIHELLAILIVMRSLYGITGYIKFYTPPVQIGLFLIWFFISCIQTKNYFKKFILRSFPLLVFLTIGIVFDLEYEGTITGYMQIFLMLAMIFAIFLYYENGYINFKKVLLSLILLDTLIIIISTISLLWSNPQFVRTLYEVEQPSGKNIFATFSTVYALCIVGIYIFISALRPNLRTLHRYFLLILFSLIAYFVFNAQFMIAILGLVFFITFFSVLSENRSKNILIIAALSIVIIFSLSLFSNLFYYLSDNTNIPLGNRSKFLELSLTLSSDYQSNFTLGGRIPTYITSINTFVNNIFLGIYSIKPYILYKDVGGHSSVFDGLAYLGLFRGIPLAAFLIIQIKIIVNQSTIVNRKALIAAFLAFLYYSIFNPVFSPQTWIVLFLVIPFFDDIFFTDYENII